LLRTEVSIYIERKGRMMIIIRPVEIADNVNICFIAKSAGVLHVL
jgi:hypothetical protein